MHFLKQIVSFAEGECLKIYLRASAPLTLKNESHDSYTVLIKSSDATPMPIMQDSEAEYNEQMKCPNLEKYKNNNNNC